MVLKYVGLFMLLSRKLEIHVFMLAGLWGLSAPTSRMGKGDCWWKRARAARAGSLSVPTSPMGLLDSEMTFSGSVTSEVPVRL